MEEDKINSMHKIIIMWDTEAMEQLMEDIRGIEMRIEERIIIIILEEELVLIELKDVDMAEEWI